MNNKENLSDETLLELLKNEDRLAFNILYNRYWKKLYNITNKRIKDREAAEEIVQDLFTSLWLNRKKSRSILLLKTTCTDRSVT